MIYEAVEDVRMRSRDCSRPRSARSSSARRRSDELFKVPKVGTVAGCYVSDGPRSSVTCPSACCATTWRSTRASIDSLKRFKDDVREVREGYECGLSIAGYNDVKVGDVIESYRVEEVARTLSQSAAS